MALEFILDVQSFSNVVVDSSTFSSNINDIFIESGGFSSIGYCTFENTKETSIEIIGKTQSVIVLCNFLNLNAGIVTTNSLVNNFNKRYFQASLVLLDSNEIVGNNGTNLFKFSLLG